ncbi:hypothetical protein BDW59DRAFT_156298 [Aspergillus cavernicola]|uniref:Uncharacterized protein n=1 Tax=Aspergillus cavernicola TaxID=176166 RepID=A0ABR4J326_9EURO
MAPRRGGGGGYYSSSTPTCSEDAFQTRLSRVYISFNALYFIVSVVLFFIASGRISRNKRAGHPFAGKHLLVVSILFATFKYADQIIVDTLGECEIYYTSDLAPGYIVSTWVTALSEYILNAVIMVSICRKLQKDFGRVQKPVISFQAAFAGLIGAFVLTGLGLNTALLQGSYSGDWDSDQQQRFLDPIKGIWTTYLVLSVVGILLASSTLVTSLVRAPEFLRSRNLNVWVGVLVISALGFNLTALGGYTYRAFADFSSFSSSEWDRYQKSNQAIYFLDAFFYSVAFYAALQVAGRHQNPVPVVDPYSRYPVN